MNFILPSTFFPEHHQNRMKHEGNVAQARKNFIEKPFRNLSFLIQKRFVWMNDWIYPSDQVIIELGSGAGLSRFYIKSDKLKLTDIEVEDWIDQKVDALNLPFEDESIDVIICSHMIHHLALPKVFLSEISKKLKPGGRIIISEIHTSLTMRVLLKMMRHEGWSYDVDVFSSTQIANKPDDRWSANCAIPELLFADTTKFEKQFNSLKIVHKEYTEFFIFPLSGGVISKVKMIELPTFMLKIIDFVDKLLIKISPKLFAMGMSVTLRKDASQTGPS